MGCDWKRKACSLHVPETDGRLGTDTRPKSLLDATHRNDLLLGKQSRRTNSCLAQYQVLQGLATKRSVDKYTQRVFPLKKTKQLPTLSYAGMKVIFEGLLAEPYRPPYLTPGVVEGKISAILRAPGRQKSGNCQHEDRGDLWKGSLHLSFHRSSEFFLS